MVKYILTNHNPKYLTDGSNNNELIKYFDVDEDYNGYKIKLIDYLEFENEYIQTLLSILKSFNEEKLTFKNSSIEDIDNDCNVTAKMWETFEKFRLKFYVSTKDIVPVFQLIFRGYLTGKVFGDKIIIEVNENNSMIITLDTSNDSLIRNSITPNICCEKYQITMEKVNK